MDESQIVLSVVGTLILVVIALCGFVWKVLKTHQDKVDGLRNDVAWVNQDLAEVKKDVEWLVWHFKKEQGE